MLCVDTCGALSKCFFEQHFKNSFSSLKSILCLQMDPGVWLLRLNLLIFMYIKSNCFRIYTKVLNPAKKQFVTYLFFQLES